MNSETWLNIEGWEGWYQVSDLGRVRSLDRESIAGGAPARYKGRVLAAGAGKNGYRTVTLTAPGCKECRNVHDLVARAFLGPPPPGHEVCHRNGVRAECAKTNLRWGTRSSNALDRHEHGTFPTEALHARGELNTKARLTESGVRYIRAHPEKTLEALGQELGVHLGTVWAVRARKTWAWLT